MADGYREYQRLQQELSQHEVPEEERLREISFMKYELEEIEQASLMHGEEEQLAEQYRMLSNATEIASGLGEIYGMTGEGNATAAEQLVSVCGSCISFRSTVRRWRSLQTSSPILIRCSPILTGISRII